MCAKVAFALKAMSPMQNATVLSQPQRTAFDKLTPHGEHFDTFAAAVRYIDTRMRELHATAGRELSAAVDLVFYKSRETGDKLKQNCVTMHLTTSSRTHTAWDTHLLGWPYIRTRSFDWSYLYIYVQPHFNSTVWLACFNVYASDLSKNKGHWLICLICNFIFFYTHSTLGCIQLKFNKCTKLCKKSTICAWENNFMWLFSRATQNC